MKKIIVTIAALAALSSAAVAQCACGKPKPVPAPPPAASQCACGAKKPDAKQPVASCSCGQVTPQKKDGVLSFFKRLIPAKKPAPVPPKAIPVTAGGSAKPAAAKSSSGSHFKCAPGEGSDCKCFGMGQPIVCGEKCRGDGCTCNFPAKPCRDTCRKGHCECPPPPKEVKIHPCQCPGMKLERGEKPASGSRDCGKGCGAPVIKTISVTYG